MQNEIKKRRNIQISATGGLTKSQIESALTPLLEQYESGTIFWYGGTAAEPSYRYKSVGYPGSLTFIALDLPTEEVVTTVTGPSSAGGTLSTLGVGDYALLSKGALTWEYATAASDQAARPVPAEYVGSGVWKLLPYGRLVWTSQNKWGAAGNAVGLDTTYSNNILYLQDDGTLGTTPGTVPLRVVQVIDGSTVYVMDHYRDTDTDTDTSGIAPTIDDYVIAGTVVLDLGGSQTTWHRLAINGPGLITAVSGIEGLHTFYMSNPSAHNVNFTAANSSQVELAPQPWAGDKIVLSAWYDLSEWVIVGVGVT